MRRLNIRFLAGLIVGVIVLGASAYGLRQFQMRRTARHLLSRAERAEQQGDPEKTESFLRQYLAYTPNDLNALIKYGQVIEKNSQGPEDRQRALNAFLQVIRRDRSRQDVRRRIVDLAMDPALRGAVDPRPHLEYLLKASPKDGELQSLLGRSEEDAGRPDKAMADYRKAIADAPGQVDTYVRLATLMRTRRGDAGGADQVMAALVAANGKSGRAYHARADYRVAWKLGGAEEDLARARELAPDDPGVLLSSARLEMSRDRTDVDRARGYLKRAAAHDPSNAKIYEVGFLLEVRANRLEDAEARLREGLGTLEGRGDLDSVRGRADLNWRLAEFLIDRRQLDEAEKSIGELRREKILPEPIEFLEARVRVAREDWDGAIKTLEGLAPRISSTNLTDLAKRVFLLLGACYERAGRPDQQYSAYRRAINLDPADLGARIGLASSLMELGKIDEAIDEFRTIVAKDARVGFVLARLLIRRNLQLPADQRSWNEARQVLDQAARATADAVDLPLLRAEILFAEDRPDDARKLLREACDRHPKRLEPWIAQAELAMRRKTPDQVPPILEEARGRLGDRAELRLAYARYWATRGESADRKALAALGEGLDRFSEQERRSILLGLSDAYLRLKDAAEAGRIMTRVAGEWKDDLRSRLALFDLALKSGDDAAIDRAVGEIRSAERGEVTQSAGGSDGVLWRYARACQLIRFAKPGDKAAMEEARGHLEAVAISRPAWSNVAVSLAEIDDLMGNHDGAIKNYLRAIVDLGERRTAPIQRTIQLLYDKRRYREADLVLRKLHDQDDSLISDDFQRLAALVSLRTGSHERAIALARKAVAADPKDYQNQILLGQALAVSGQLREAEASLRLATTLAADRPETWEALVELLAATDKGKAEATIREAQGKLPKEKADVALAHCYLRIGDRDRAKEKYEAALSAAPEDRAVLRELVGFYLQMNRPEEAKAYLRRSIALKSIPPEDRKAAARLLATLEAANGNPRQLREALAILGVTDEAQPVRADAGEAADDLRAKARVLSMHRSRARRQDAIKILESLSDREPPTVEDRDLLAQLYELDGNWSKARDQMRTVIASAEENPSYLSYLNRYAVRFLDHGDLSEAVACFNKLKKLEPTSLRTVELEARMKKEQGRDAEALALLRNHAQANDAEAGRVAAILETLGHSGAAETLYRHAADQAKSPGPLLNLAGCLARQSRVGEALDVCERAGKYCSPEQLVDAGVAVLDAANADETQIQRVDRWIAGVLERDPKSLSALFSLANLRSLEGRYREAETLYRRCIEMSPGSSGPLNNLAWLLAFEAGREAEALAWINRAIAGDGPSPDLLDTRAVVLMRMGRYAEAIRELEDASLAAPKNASLYFHMAQARQLSKNGRAASEAFNQAKALGLRVASLHPVEKKAYHDIETRAAGKQWK